MTLIKSISGIRGTIGGKTGDGLTPVDIVKFSSAYAAWLRTRSENNKVVIGRDARPTGEMVSKLVAATLQGMGMNVVDLGLSTTPTVEIAVVLEKAAGGIILTASHNPVQWNALKLLNEKGEFISGDDGQAILDLAESADYNFSEVKKIGKYTTQDHYIQKHIDMVIDLPLVDVAAIRERKFKVVVDAVNSTGGIAIPKLLKSLGVAEVRELYCYPDGNFPHNPEPLPENITHISNELANGSYDLGFVLDPDVDRLAIVNEDGTPFGEEYTLVAVADYILSQQKGNTVSNLSSTRALRDVTEKRGGKYEASAVGEVNVVTKMKETNAIIGGEGNGGIIYPELHYGRDALVGIALFLTHLAKSGKSCSQLRASFPSYHISKNKIELTPEIDVDGILEAIQVRYKNQPINTIDGVKVEFDKEWVHLRKSNTEPIIRIYSESDSESKAEHLAQKMISDIKEIIAYKEN
ncbi:phosphoglucosamine mutase [Marivirga tractuosa]|uniref:Phosphoglucomutase/phosphomannomutase alpha/beta/alpha domain I n=1 Tax=Marivirga tractuosa (strain ATCC 23168 / DSM 4126 / NBRC 15989 / NCIMB 1408 / VKM B-1430 / H-43) TaxID=643867 RepID=E4TQ97_MARTH|nr:phosphoglucosamine mutase [Marivirga tractuosa]ADR22620.1 phosphoglucomutase/phosphomannomutase alpha/beta/alpha domain I [Marivirga tractuosa DSM 4126]BDD16709.1 phosphoglucosamine mutase [Marivirga tractuosa]